MTWSYAPTSDPEVFTLRNDGVERIDVWLHTGVEHRDLTMLAIVHGLNNPPPLKGFTPGP